jgi:hypothetical protein
LGHLVSASGKNGAFTVVRIDESEGVAPLELKTGTYFIEKNIPFNAIHSLGEDVNQAAARIAREATEGN